MNALSVPYPGAPAPGCWYPGTPCPACSATGRDPFDDEYVCLECDARGQIPGCTRCGVQPAASCEEECEACLALPRCRSCSYAIATIEDALCLDCARKCPECCAPAREPVVLAHGENPGRYCAACVGAEAVKVARNDCLPDVERHAGLDALMRYVAAVRGTVLATKPAVVAPVRRLRVAPDCACGGPMVASCSDCRGGEVSP